MRNLNIFLFLCLAFLFSGISEGEVCSTGDNESVLRAGYDYTYRFKSEAIAEAVGTTNDKSKISIQCSVLISHASECSFTLQLQECNIGGIGGPPGSETAWMDHQSLPDLSKYPIQFSLVNGSVTEIYTHEDDPVYFINIKRGALSAFVFKLSYTSGKTVEMHTDIHGICPLTVKPIATSEGSVKTTKDMLSCSLPSRKDWQYSPWSMFWNMSFIQHVINSTTDCDYKLDTIAKRISKVTCKERHAIMLESSHRTALAVQTNIYYSMSYEKSSVQEKKPSTASLTRKSDIRFEYERTLDPELNPENFLVIANQMLFDLVEESRDEIKLFTNAQFSSFIAWIRMSPNLMPLVEAVKSCSFVPAGIDCTLERKELAMSFLRDALVQCNSLACIEATAHLAKSDDFNQAYLNFIFYTWGNMHFFKTSIFQHVMDVCVSTNSNLCWISLGSLLKKSIISRNRNFEAQELLQLQEVARYFFNKIDNYCTSSNNDENTNKILPYLKALGNLGEESMFLIPEGKQQLIDCVLKYEHPMQTKVSIFETLKNINPCKSGHCEDIYQQLLHYLRNNTTPTTLRIMTYDFLIHIPQKYNFEREVTHILKMDDDLQLKFYIASSLNSLFMDPDFKQKEKRFVQLMDQLLTDNEISLDAILFEKGGKSFTNTHIISTELPFVPLIHKKLGFKLATSNVYEQADVLPRYFQGNVLMQVLSKFVTLVEAGGYSEGLEDLAIVIQKTVDDINVKKLSLEKIFTGLQQVLKDFGLGDANVIKNFSFDETILKNVRKLEEVYRSFKPKSKPSFTTYLDLFGSTLGYISSEDIMSLIAKLRELSTLSDEKIFSYNTTKVIRIIEAYHQFPTMMGLPLNWTTDATLALSLKSGLKLQLNPQMFEAHSKGYIQPSAALTFLNRMVLDFPTITKIGIQANSSGYTSTQWQAKLDYSKGRKVFSIEKPGKTQKFLELFRTNQIIKHNSSVDIPDWDIERTTSTWCTSNEHSSFLGLQLCVDKSYPLVTERFKPWALMSGWCKWQLHLKSFDEKLKSYDFEIVKLPGIRSKDIILRFITTGSDKKREITFIGNTDEAKGEIKFEIKVTESPNFAVSFFKSNNKQNGCRSVLILRLDKDIQYELLYNDQVKQEDQVLNNPNSNMSGNKKVTAVVGEQSLSLNTPYNAYRYRRETKKIEESEIINVFLSYENLNPIGKWLHQILPSSFWENDSNAWIRLQINWKEPNSDPNSLNRHTISVIKIPQSCIELSANSIEMDGKEQIHLNLTKREDPSGKLLAFANFTYGYSNSQSSDRIENEIRAVNLTISKKSWSAQVNKIRENSKLSYEVSLKRAILIAKKSENYDFVGWWHEDISQDFWLKEHQAKVVINTDTELIDSKSLAEKYSVVSKEDIENLSNKLIKTNITFYYPFYTGKESVKFYGYLIFSRGPTTFRFQEDFVSESSYNKLQLITHSVFKTDTYSTTLDHNSEFTNLESQNKAYHIIEFKRTYPEGMCREQIEIKHSIKSNVFYLSSNGSYKANSKELYTLLIDIQSNSTYWDMLNTKLSQIVEEVNSEYMYETCNFSHPLLNINVTADWVGKYGERDHQKKVVFSSPGGRYQNSEIHYRSQHQGKSNLELIMPNDNGRKLTYQRTLSSNAKNLKFKINYSDNKEDENNLQLIGQIINERFHVWKTNINLDKLSSIRRLINNGFETISQKFTVIAKNKDHPLNQILESTLKTTLYDYIQNLKKQRNDLMILSWENIKETLRSLKPFYDEPVEVLNNVIAVSRETSRQFYNVLKEKSVIIWAINYFNIPDYFNNYSGLVQLLIPEDRNIQFEFVTGRILEWESFKEWPSISFEDIKRKPFSTKNEIEPHYHPSSSAKIAMIFGPLHVYTFDDFLYDSAEYSSDCVFLLAHDLRKSSFTVLSTKKAIHVLFPEMSISVNDENEVFINGSHVQSSLPVAAYNGKVFVSRSNTVEIRSPSLNVICSGKDFLCVLELNIWHHGGTFGLLGNADGLSYNEYMAPNGKITADTLEFVKSYEVSGKPECKNLRLLTNPTPSEKARELCTSQFSHLCQLSTRKTFIDICKSDLQQDPNACYARSGYSALCFFKSLPSKPIDCHGKKQENKKIGQKLEVVFIVQEHSAFSSAERKTSPYKGIERMLTAVEDRFKANGYSNILYSLIGFGRKGAYNKPTVHTSDRNVWVPLQTLVNDMLKRLVFDGEEETDAVNVLRYATEVLGFDTFNSKIVIIITTKDRKSNNKQTLHTTQDHLEKNGITLYTFSTYPSIEKGKKVFGVRADGLIFPSPKKEGTAFLDYPKGDLAKLTSATRGSIFLSKFLVSNSPASFFGEFAEEVWSKIHKEIQSCRECTPVKSGWWWQVNECNQVHC